MKNLLSKEQVYLLNEKAVDWDKSLLGVLTKGVLSPISWLTGSIKKGVKMKQLNNLVMQWGLEYVKALKNIDTNESEENISNDKDSLQIGKEYHYKNDKGELKKVKVISLTNVVKTGDDKEFLTNDDVIGEPIKDKHVFIVFQNKDGKYLGVNPTMSVLISKILPLSEENISNDDKINKVDDLKILEKQKNNLIIIKNVLDKILKWVSINNDTGFTQIKKEIEQANIELDINILSKIIPFIENKEIKNINNYISIIENFVKTIKESTKANDFIKKLNIKSNNYNDFNIFKNDFKNDITDRKNTLDKIINIYTLGIEYLNTLENNTENIDKNDIKESYIKEAKEYKLPKTVTELLPQEDLNKLKEIENIKTNTTKDINIKALDAIKYEAEYLITKAKDNKDENVLELQKTWDLGIKQINDYFQDVINVDKIMNQVKAQADNQLKTQIESTEDRIENLQKMEITETFEVGAKFNVKKLYALDCTIIGKQQKKLILLVSPTSEFIEDIDGIKYFWFKLLGGYEWDKKQKKTIRVNIFENITTNKKIINNFEKVESSYYIALRNLRPTDTYSYMWIYSKTGKFFFNNKIVQNTDEVANELKTYKKDKFDASLKSLFLIANLFKIKINQRFIVDDENIKLNKYPGIQLKDLIIDKDFDKAVDNHNKLLKIIQ